MNSPSRSHSGLALAELLVAIAIFGIIMVVAYAAIGSSLRVQADQEALTTAQGKLRRVMEVLTQDLRSAVFGSITSQPYLPAGDQVSFMMLTGGAGHPVLAPESAFAFPGSTRVDVQMPDASYLPGKQIVMIDSHTGTGVIKPVTSVEDRGSGVWRLTSSCTNTLPWNTQKSEFLVFEISTVGLRYDGTDGTLLFTEAGSPEVPFAFGLHDFRIEYVYTTPAGEVNVSSEPYLSADGYPVRTYNDAGTIRTLHRIQFIAAVESTSRNRVTEHAHTGQVDLSRNEHYQVEEIIPCM